MENHPKRDNESCLQLPSLAWTQATKQICKKG